MFFSSATQLSSTITDLIIRKCQGVDAVNIFQFSVQQNIGIFPRLLQECVTCPRRPGSLYLAMTYKAMMLSDQGKCSAVPIPWLRRQRESYTTGSSRGSSPLQPVTETLCCSNCTAFLTCRTRQGYFALSTQCQ
jgi:hypothetical protein